MRLLWLLLLLLPLAACQTSRVQSFSVSRDQRESYILEVICSISVHELCRAHFSPAVLLFARRNSANSSE
jgi:hypothetical protein